MKTPPNHFLLKRYIIIVIYLFIVSRKLSLIKNFPINKSADLTSLYSLLLIKTWLLCGKNGPPALQKPIGCCRVESDGRVGPKPRAWRGAEVLPLFPLFVKQTNAGGAHSSSPLPHLKTGELNLVFPISQIQSPTLSGYVRSLFFPFVTIPCFFFLVNSNVVYLIVLFNLIF